MSSVNSTGSFGSYVNSISSGAGQVYRDASAIAASAPEKSDKVKSASSEESGGSFLSEIPIIGDLLDGLF